MTVSCATSRKSTISRLHAIEAGTGPLALCLHGITANGYVFEPLMTALAARFRVVSLDQRGHGRSPKPARGYASLDYANDLQDVLNEKALLIGHSLGARNALVAGLRFPGRVAAVARDAWANTRALRADLPAVEIAGADHYVPEERPHEVAAAVLEFWDSMARRKA